jgi:hypothetical protein
MMSDLYNKIVNSRGSFENLVARIPGFKGYQEKQARRTADRLLRDYIAGLVDERLRRLVRIEKLILDNGGLSYMSKTRDIKGKLQLYRDKIATAAPKYDGMWAQMKIGNDELDKIYSFDEAQIAYVDRIDVELDHLQNAATSKEGIDTAIFEFGGLLDEAIDAFNLRDDVLTELGNFI